jgi:hypothetical protein
MFTGCADTNVHTLAPVDLLWHEAEIILARPRQVIFDGVQKFSIDSEMSHSPTITNKLFAYANSSTVPPTSLGIGRIASFSVTDAATGEKIQDLIPVRKDGVGYMYDKVSGNLLGNSGTGDFVIGPDKPYDYEVEYIERDYGIPWLIDGENRNGGFDLSQYLVSGESIATSSRAVRLTWSFVPESATTRSALYYVINLLSVGRSCTKANNSTKYRFTAHGSYYSQTDGDIDVFHTQEMIPDGNGNWRYIFDGAELYSQTQTLATNFIKIFLMYGTYTKGSAFKMRIKSFSLGNDIDMIPVVKSGSVGFYNKVDGELFLAEQACLSAGPRV